MKPDTALSAGVRPATHDNVRSAENSWPQLALWDSTIPTAANRHLKECCRCRNEATMTVDLASGTPLRTCPECVWTITTRSHAWVYFVRIGDRVKIGTSRSLVRRLNTLQAAAPEPLILWHLIEGGSDIERQLHADFADDWLHNEWFQISPQIQWFVEGRIREHHERRMAPWEARWGSGVAA